MNLRDELMQIRSERGELTPRNVFDTARDPQHPLHPIVFDKPVEQAAEAYYLDRCARLIRAVRLKLPTGDPSEPRDIRAFQAVRQGDAPTTFVYEPSEEVAVDPLKRAIVLREMEREWRQLRRRWETFREFTELIRREAEELAS